MITPMTNPVRPQLETPRDEAAFRAAVENGIESADAGRMVPYEKVRAWLQSWGKPGELPAPE